MAHLGYSSWLRLFVARFEGDQAAIDAEFHQVVDADITPADWMALFMAEFMGNPNLTTTHNDDESGSEWSLDDAGDVSAEDHLEDEEAEPARRTESSHAAPAQKVEVEQEQLKYRAQGES